MVLGLSDWFGGLAQRARGMFPGIAPGGAGPDAWGNRWGEGFQPVRVGEGRAVRAAVAVSAGGRREPAALSMVLLVAADGQELHQIAAADSAGAGAAADPGVPVGRGTTKP